MSPRIPDRVELSQLSRVRDSLIDAQRFILLDGADGDVLVQVFSNSTRVCKAKVVNSKTVDSNSVRESNLS
jgi:midasin